MSGSLIIRLGVYKLISLRSAVADPGFPVGGRRPRREALTPEAVTFHKFCMSKQKNLDPWGAYAGTPL